MIPVYQICRAYHEALERAAIMPDKPNPFFSSFVPAPIEQEASAMAKLPTKLKIPARGRAVHIGDQFAAQKDDTGKTKVKPKAKRRPLPQQIAASKRKTWRAAK